MLSVDIGVKNLALCLADAATGRVKALELFDTTETEEPTAQEDGGTSKAAGGKKRKSKPQSDGAIADACVERAE